MNGLAAVAVLAALAVGFAVSRAFERARRARALRGAERLARIALPFTGAGLSEPALAAALRLARAEEAVLMPVYLALVPLRLSVEVPLLGESELALSQLEAIEQRAARAHVPVDARIERGRTIRHALRELIAHERFERMVVAAGASGSEEGFEPDDVAWMLARVPAELIVLRPARETRDGRPAGRRETSVRELRAALSAPLRRGVAVRAWHARSGASGK